MKLINKINKQNNSHNKSEKQNRYTPGTHIPIIKKPKKINPLKTIFYLGAWNFLREIKRKEKKFVSGGGKFLIHTPYPRII